MKKLLTLVLATTLLLSFAACGRKPVVAIPNAALILGEKYLFDMDYDQAMLQFDEAIIIEPKNPRAWLGKYATLEFLGRHEEALLTLQDAVKETNDGEIRTVLEAAMISKDEGLVATAEAYKKCGFKEIALKLLRLCVKVFQGVERFITALSGLLKEMGLADESPMQLTTERVTTEKVADPSTSTTAIMNRTTTQPTTQKPPASKNEISNYFASNGKRFSISGSELARALDCNNVEQQQYATRYSSNNGTIIDVDYENRVINLTWTSPAISIFGLRVGDSAEKFEATLKQNGFEKADWTDNLMYSGQKALSVYYLADGFYIECSF